MHACVRAEAQAWLIVCFIPQAEFVAWIGPAQVEGSTVSSGFSQSLMGFNLIGKGVYLRAPSDLSCLVLIMIAFTAFLNLVRKPA